MSIDYAWKVTEEGLVGAAGYGTWVGSPRCESPTEDEAWLIENRHNIEILAEVSDETLSYEYYDLALIRVGKRLYVLETSGCSCPSPAETWRVAAGPKETLAELRKDGFIRHPRLDGLFMEAEKELASEAAQ